MRDAASVLMDIEVLRCDACHQLDSGPREFCMGCGGPVLYSHTVAGLGCLVSWTVIRRAPTQFKQDAPYTVVVVELDAGVRMTGRLARNDDALTAGDRLACVGMVNGCPRFERFPAAMTGPGRHRLRECLRL